MKTKIEYLLGLFLILFTQSTISSDGQIGYSAAMRGEIADEIGRMGDDVEKFRYLSSLFEQLDEGNRGRAEILYLLGEIKTEASFDLLLKNIEFKWLERKNASEEGVAYYPSRESMVRLGKYAVSSLYKVILVEKDFRRMKILVDLYREIEGLEAWVKLFEDGTLDGFTPEERGILGSYSG